MSGAILLIIDMLNDFFRQHTGLAARRASLVASINELSGAFRRADQPIIWVCQQFDSDLSDAFPEMRRDGVRLTIKGTEGCELLPELQRDGRDRTLVKKRYSAFFGTDLDSILAEIYPATVVIAGINTHACVRMTAIDAYQRDYTVVIASDCIASYDDEHHEITNRYLARGIAQFHSNSEIARLL